MRNSDMPAMPQTNPETYPIGLDGLNLRYSEGLTKHEYFAAMAMQGCLAADVDNNFTPEDIVLQSIQCADALLAALEKD